jgi:hypothetical protein
MTHTIIVTDEDRPEFQCQEPDTAWCRQNLLNGPDDPENEEFWREHPSWCWYTVLMTGFVPWGEGGTYDGPPTELRSGEVVFTKIEEGGHQYPKDFVTWHYEDDAREPFGVIR